MPDDYEEKKVIFREGDEVRALRGIIDHEDEFFVYVKRRDGKHKIGKSAIIRISPVKKGGGC